MVVGARAQRPDEERGQPGEGGEDGGREERDLVLRGYGYLFVGVVGTLSFERLVSVSVRLQWSVVELWAHVDGAVRSLRRTRWLRGGARVSCLGGGVVR